MSASLTVFHFSSGLQCKGSSLLGALNLDPQSVGPDLLSLFAWWVAYAAAAGGIAAARMRAPRDLPRRSGVGDGFERL